MDDTKLPTIDEAFAAARTLPPEDQQELAADIMARVEEVQHPALPDEVRAKLRDRLSRPYEEIDRPEFLAMLRRHAPDI